MTTDALRRVDDTESPLVATTGGPLAGLPPQRMIQAATEIADTLAQVIDRCNLAVTISGREFVRVEGWCTLATMCGCSVREVTVEPIEDGYCATAEVVRTSDGQVIGRGSAVCLRTERNWSGKPEHAIRSMASTRSASKSCRLCFAWILALAGRFEMTPLEEAEGVVDGDRRSSRRPASRRSGQRSPSEQRSEPDSAKVLGHAGAKRLLGRLGECGKSWQALLVRLKAQDMTAWELVTGVAIEDIPTTAFGPIKAILDDFEAEAADAAAEAARDADADALGDALDGNYEDLDESSIPF